MQASLLEQWRGCSQQLLSAQSPFALAVDEQGQKHFVNAPADLIEALQAGRRHANAPFLLWREQRFSFAEFYAAADQMTAALQQILRIQPGERVAIAMRNRPEWMIAFVACVQAGAVPVPLNSWGLHDELLYAIEDAGAAALICDPERLQQLQDSLQGVQVILVDGQPAAGQHAWAALLDAELAPMQLASVKPDDAALMMYTSGTTSRAKGVLSNHRAVAQSLFALEYQGALAGMTSPERIKPIMESGLQPTALLCFPLFHVSGLHAQFLSMLRNGRRMVIMYKWDAEEALRLIETERCTQFNGAPVMMLQLINHPRFDSSATATLFALGLGGGAPSPALLERLLSVKPLAMVGSGYGMTESNGVGSAQGGEQFVHFSASSGWPLPLVDVVIGESPERPLPPGQPGPIWLRSVTLMQGYWNRQEETEQVLQNGWLFSGDVGYLDEHGMVYLTDRIKDIIIRGGENISALEVEQCVAGHEAVIEAAAFALPDAELGECVGLVACVSEEVSEQQLRTFLAGKLAPFKIPSRIWFTREPLQRNATGKLQKPQIKQALGLA